MKDKLFMRVEEVQEQLCVSRAFAYNIIRDLNKELEAKGFKVINGRVSRKYFNEKFYGIKDDEKGEQI